MNLNTYRCGCGRIETLPHAKARPGPCVHVERPRLPEKTFDRRELLGGLWMPPEVVAAIRAGAKVSVPRETSDGRWVCDVEPPSVFTTMATPDGRTVRTRGRHAAPAPAICRWRTDIQGADRLRYAKAAQMYAEGLHRRGLGAYVLVTQIKGGVDVVRVAFDTEEMEHAWVDAVDYRRALAVCIQATTNINLGWLRHLDVPGKRPSWFPV